MTLKEYAIQKAEELKSNPHSIKTIANSILNCTVGGRPITRTHLNQILEYIEEELGGFEIALENFSNTETLSLMAQLRAEIEKSLEDKDENND